MQPHTTLSSTQEGKIVLNDGAKEILWVIRLLEKITIKIQKSVSIFVDNQSVMALAKHKMIKPITKHIALRYHWIREKLKEEIFNLNEEIFKLNYIPSEENLTDLFTFYENPVLVL